MTLMDVKTILSLLLLAVIVGVLVFVARATYRGTSKLASKVA